MRNMLYSTNQKGSTVAEFAIVSGLFFMIIFGIIEFGRLLYTHNALTDAARRGARYAVLHGKNITCVKNVVIYGETHVGAGSTCPPTGPALINGLTPDNVVVDYDPPATYDMNNGTATVKIQNYQFNLSIPFFRQRLTMPAYTTTLTAESAGRIPADIP
ncbi:MAG TPA: TadE family protein [Pyrinomonadaceae bacterium]|nr:TadE family protein [Pyrinomonadaceae bacterium]